MRKHDEWRGSQLPPKDKYPSANTYPTPQQVNRRDSVTQELETIDGVLGWISRKSIIWQRLGLETMPDHCTLGGGWSQKYMKQPGAMVVPITQLLQRLREEEWNFDNLVRLRSKKKELWGGTVLEHLTVRPQVQSTIPYKIIMIIIHEVQALRTSLGRDASRNQSTFSWLPSW